MAPYWFLDPIMPGGRNGMREAVPVDAIHVHDRDASLPWRATQSRIIAAKSA
jgi:hypothetical protein